jgi:hypothetical protein
MREALTALVPDHHWLDRLYRQPAKGRVAENQQPPTGCTVRPS